MVFKTLMNSSYVHNVIQPVFIVPKDVTVGGFHNDIYLLGHAELKLTISLYVTF